MARNNRPQWPIMCVRSNARGRDPEGSPPRQCRNRACPGSTLCRIHGGVRQVELRRRRFLLYCLTGNLELAMRGSKEVEAAISALILACITDNAVGLSPEAVLSAATELLGLAMAETPPDPKLRKPAKGRPRLPADPSKPWRTATQEEASQEVASRAPFTGSTVGRGSP